MKCALFGPRYKRLICLVKNWSLVGFRPSFLPFKKYHLVPGKRRKNLKIFCPVLLNKFNVAKIHEGATFSTGVGFYGKFANPTKFAKCIYQEFSFAIAKRDLKYNRDLEIIQNYLFFVIYS
jgi:hypothetical protein